MKLRRTLLSFALAVGVAAPALGGAEIISTAQPAGACPLLGCSSGLLGLLSGGSIFPGGNASLVFQSTYVGIVLNVPVIVTGNTSLVVEPNRSARLHTADAFGVSNTTGTVTVTSNAVIFSGGGASATFLFSGNRVVGGHVLAQEHPAQT